jgi:flagellar basal body rod protein FlgC
MSTLSISTSGLLASTAIVADAAKAAAGVRDSASASGAGTSRTNPVDIVDIGSGGAQAVSSGYAATSSSSSTSSLDVGPVRSTIDQISASASFQANVSAIRSAEQMLQGLLATVV